MNLMIRCQQNPENSRHPHLVHHRVTLQLIMFMVCFGSGPRLQAQTAHQSEAVPSNMVQATTRSPILASLPLVVERRPGFDLKIESFSLNDSSSLNQLASQLEALLSERDLTKAKTHRQAIQTALVWVNELRLAETAPVRNETQIQALQDQVSELLVSFDSNFLSPEPLSGDILGFPSLLNRPIGIGTRPAQDLGLNGDAVARAGQDLSLLQPRDSSFWQMPRDLAAQNLFNGYGRPAATAPSSEPCIYFEKKGGYGTNGGFTIQCGKTKFKTKWGSETHVEPFNSRLVHALGYDTKISDYWTGVTLRYDRRIFSEYNLRDDLSVQISLLLIPITRLHIFRRLDPFAVLTSVRLKDGTKLTPAEFKKRLLKKSDPGSEEQAENYDQQFESLVDTVSFKELSVQAPEPHTTKVGSWGWGDLGFYKGNQTLPGSSLGHENLRELRGFGLLAAWLNVYDMRWDNNKLKLVKDKNGAVSLRHMISDLGSGLGVASNLLSLSNGNVNAFPWSFTIGAPCQAPDGPHSANQIHCERLGFAIVGFQTADINPTFAKMTRDDARWMARWISRLTLSQIESALAAAGFNQAEIYLYARKLAHRRDQMNADLGLREIAPLLGSDPDLGDQTQAIDNETRDFNRDPLVIIRADGTRFTPPTNGCWLARGDMHCPTPAAGTKSSN